jgi:hypothetical protein
MIETKQESLASMFDWDILTDSWDHTVSTRYTAFSTTDINSNTAYINFDRHPDAWVRYSLKWLEMGYDINPEDLNLWDSDLNQTNSVIQKWRFKQGDRTQFEVWPLPSTAQTVRFTGARRLATLRTANVLDTTKTLELDDRLVAYSVAKDILSAQGDQSVTPVVEELRAIWNTIRGSDPKRRTSFGRYPDRVEPLKRVVPIVTV